MPTLEPPTAYGPGDVLPDGSTLLIGNIDPRSDAADRLLDGITVALQEFDTETLRAIADYRDTINPDGWMQRLIREYVDVWRALR
jgi:hypothetical protein